jgi:hypothetical protein
MAFNKAGTTVGCRHSRFTSARISSMSRRFLRSRINSVTALVSRARMSIPINNVNTHGQRKATMNTIWWLGCIWTHGSVACFEFLFYLCRFEYSCRQLFLIPGKFIPQTIFGFVAGVESGFADPHRGGIGVRMRRVDGALK